MPQPFDLAWLTPAQQRAWRLMLIVMSQLQSDLNRQLQADSPLSFQDFDVLVHLQESPDRRLRLGELAASLGWERSRASHHVARMERRALVRRERVSDDGRGAWVVATPEGFEVLHASAQEHVLLVRTLLYDGLDERDVDDFARVLTKIAHNLGCTPKVMWHMDPGNDDEPHTAQEQRP